MRGHLIMSLLGIAATSTIAARSTGAPLPAAAYESNQAEKGAQLYAQRCAMCHGRALEGTFETPSLTGKFIANWGDRPLSDLYDYLGRAMPQFAPGTLTDEETARIVAFLLKANGATAGATPLPADSAALRKVRLGPLPPR
jgi:mono/diheme cytochrome c family protein